MKRFHQVHRVSAPSSMEKSSAGRWVRYADVVKLTVAVKRCLPFIDDADDIQQFYPDSAATKECREAIADLRAVLAQEGLL